MANLDGLHPIVREATEKLIEVCKEKDIDIIIAQAYRSIAEQNALFAKGRTTAGPKVTNARGGTSYHNYGLAIDYCLKVDGKAIWTVNKDWRTVAEEAKKIGFEWGGEWKTFIDYPHLQMTFGLSIKDLQAGKRPVIKEETPEPAKEGAVKESVTPKPTPTKVVTVPFPGKPVKLRSEGKNVERVQRAVGIAEKKVDGIYGKDTEKAVKAYQKRKGLKADGIVGAKTWAVMF
ncbi:M15 family metallopeptidase [Peribacillus butanolivorans]|uniref:Peptidase M15 n=1 Tax=Peribacillus butanolivorans TaxID=421767 RepID=A0ABN5N9K4_9BACI|nr:M15 family metallopeptidase [Peribacillus butanolivorans]AXN39869.1 peptidase M15 [Peribacillus butanolivorans]